MSWEILEGDALERLAGLADGSVQCVVTSPPYFGLRDYGTGEWEGGEPGCDHVAPARSSTADGLASWSAEHAAGGGHAQTVAAVQRYSGTCGKCGARRTDRQVGLEATPDEFVARLVEVFREVRRVLRDDGTVWLNIGDSYHGGGYANHAINGEAWLNAHGGDRRRSRQRDRIRANPDLKPKDLLMIPAQLALALRADGWYLRSEIVWAKPNPMPESVTDRPTSAHEKLFLLAKSPRYFYDADAIRDPSPAPERRRGARGDVRQPSSRDAEKLGNGHAGHGYAGSRGETEHGAGRNKRNVWSVATVPFADAHFATFPTALIEPCVLAGSSSRACGVCGAPWRRVTERATSFEGNSARSGRDLREISEGGKWTQELRGGNADLKAGPVVEVRTVGWEPSCAHQDGSTRSVVLDPFAGSGTVGVVCEWHGRDFVGVELSPEYAEMARRRIVSEGPLGRRAHRPARELEGQLGLEL